MQHGSTYTCCLLATRLSLVAKAALKLPGSEEDHGAPWTWNSPQTSSPSSSLQEKGVYTNENTLNKGVVEHLLFICFFKN